MTLIRMYKCKLIILRIDLIPFQITIYLFTYISRWSIR